MRSLHQQTTNLARCGQVNIQQPPTDTEGRHVRAGCQKPQKLVVQLLRDYVLCRGDLPAFGASWVTETEETTMETFNLFSFLVFGLHCLEIKLEKMDVRICGWEDFQILPLLVGQCR